ncbi:hypothetical protein TI04_09870, partial [Achromatium sp. WMS2]
IETATLSQLQKNTNIIVLPSDKNLGPCIMEREKYFHMILNDHLLNNSCYKKLTNTEAHTLTQHIDPEQELLKSIEPLHDTQPDIYNHYLHMAHCYVGNLSYILKAKLGVLELECTNKYPKSIDYATKCQPQEQFQGDSVLLQIVKKFNTTLKQSKDNLKNCIMEGKSREIKLLYSNALKEISKKLYCLILDIISMSLPLQDHSDANPDNQFFHSEATYIYLYLN